MALRWHNLPCALKAAIGYRKRTLGDPGQSDPPRGPQQGPAASAFATRNGRDMLALSMPLDDPVRTSGHAFSCAIQPRQPPSGLRDAKADFGDP